MSIHSVKRILGHSVFLELMEPKDSLQSSKEPATGYYSDLRESSL
jgi:hypothetical protein